MSEVIKFTVVNDEGEEEDLECPAVFDVCSKCEGKGTHVNPAVDENGISPEEFAEDREFQVDYFNGVYDVTCQECDGKRVVLIPDHDNADTETLSKYEEWVMSQDKSRREREHELKMGY